MAEPNAFLIGSRVYGEPSPDSDIDLVVMLTNEEANKLASCADLVKGSTPDSLMFGKLNLIILEPWKFNAWLNGTRQLIARKPVTREQAVEVLEAAELAAIAEMKAAREIA